MKLLLDENLSRRLVPALQARFPGSSQVALLGLERATDIELCDYAARYDFVICAKDDDFQRLVAARGYRPRLIHLALGNTSNDVALTALLAAADRLHLSFDDDAIGVVDRLNEAETHTACDINAAGLTMRSDHRSM